MFRAENDTILYGDNITGVTIALTVTISQSSRPTNERWIVFLVKASAAKGQIFVTHAKGLDAVPKEEWLPVTDDSLLTDKPREKSSSVRIFEAGGALFDYVMLTNNATQMTARIPK
jgi:hypothetical protein